MSHQLRKLMLLSAGVFVASSHVTAMNNFWSKIKKPQVQIHQGEDLSADPDLQIFNQNLGLANGLNTQGFLFGENFREFLHPQNVLATVYLGEKDRFNFWHLAESIKNFDRKANREKRNALKQKLQELEAINQDIRVLEGQQKPTQEPSGESNDMSNSTMQEPEEAKPSPGAEKQQEKERLISERDSLRQEIAREEQELAAAYAGIYQTIFRLLASWDYPTADEKITVAHKFIGECLPTDSEVELLTLSFLAKTFFEIQPNNTRVKDLFLVRLAGWVADLDDEKHHIALACLEQLVNLYTNAGADWKNQSSDSKNSRAGKHNLINQTLNSGFNNFFNNLHIFSLALAYRVAIKNKDKLVDVDFFKFFNNNVGAMYSRLLDAFKIDETLAQTMLSTYKQFILNLSRFYDSMDNEPGRNLLQDLGISIKNCLALADVQNVSEDFLDVLGAFDLVIETKRVKEHKIQQMARRRKSKESVNEDVPDEKASVSPAQQKRDADWLNQATQPSDNPLVSGIKSVCLSLPGGMLLQSGASIIDLLFTIPNMASPVSSACHALWDAANEIKDKIIAIDFLNETEKLFDLLSKWFKALNVFYKVTNQGDKASLATFQADYWAGKSAASKTTKERNRRKEAFNQTVANMNNSFYATAAFSNWLQKIISFDQDIESLEDWAKTLLSRVTVEVHPDHLKYPTPDDFNRTMGKLFTTQWCIRQAYEVIAQRREEIDSYQQQQNLSNYVGVKLDILAFGILIHRVFKEVLQTIDDKTYSQIGDRCSQPNCFEKESRFFSKFGDRKTATIFKWLQYRTISLTNACFYRMSSSLDLSFDQLKTNFNQQIPQINLNPNQCSFDMPNASTDYLINLMSDVSTWIKVNKLSDRFMSVLKDGVNAATGQFGVTFG